MSVLCHSVEFVYVDWDTLLVWEGGFLLVVPHVVVVCSLHAFIGCQVEGHR